MQETISRVKVGEEGKSPILFNILTVDLEEELRKGRWGGARIRARRICSLVYADDVVVLAEREEEMESMVRRLEGYFEVKKLQVNVVKTKIIRFERRSEIQGGGLVVEGDKDRGGEGIQLSGLCV